MLHVNLNEPLALLSAGLQFRLKVELRSALGEDCFIVLCRFKLNKRLVLLDQAE
jgi:hypothetical protein